MRAFRARQREQAAEQPTSLPPELAQLLTAQESELAAQLQDTKAELKESRT